MAKKKHIDRWRETCPVTGKTTHRQETFVTRAARDAHRWRRQARAVQPAAAVTFREFASRWMAEHARPMTGRSTQAVYQQRIDTHLLPAFGDLSLGELGRAHLLALRAALASRPRQRGKKVISAKTANDVLMLARSIMGGAVERGLIQANPFQGVENLPTVKRKVSYWTKEERDRFLTFARRADPYFAELVTVAVETGMRRGELRGLERRHLDFDRGLITVDGTWSAFDGCRQEWTKNLEDDFVPMSSGARAVLADRRLLAPASPVFDPELFRVPHRRLARLCRLAGVKRLRFHDLRHTFASIKVMEGVPLFTVRRLLRQRSDKAVLVYAHLAPDYLRDEIERGCTQSVRVSYADECKVIGMTR